MNSTWRNDAWIWFGASLVGLGSLWAPILRTDVTPGGDGERVIRFIEFVRSTAGGLVFWNPLRNGGYPTFGDAEHFWALAALTDPTTPWGRLVFNGCLFALLIGCAIPIWLIGRRFNWSPYWSALAIVLLGFSERLVDSQESGRFSFLFVHLALLLILWLVLSERLRPWHYVALVVCLEIVIQEVVDTALLYWFIICAGLLAHRKSETGLRRHVLTSTIVAIAIGLGGLLLSAAWTLPLVEEFSHSYVPISALKYTPNLPGSVIEYARVFVPFVQSNPELVVFTSLLLVPALIWGARGPFGPAQQRLACVGIPVFLWALVFIAMSIPVLGPLIQFAYTLSPLVASMRWFSLLEDAASIILIIGAIGVFCARQQQHITELGLTQRISLGLFFGLCTVAAIGYAGSQHEPLAALYGTITGIFAVYFVVSSNRRLSIGSVEQLSTRAFVGMLSILSLAAVLIARQDWERVTPYTNSAPALPALESIVRSDGQPYFRYIREDDSNLWSLDSYKRGFRSFSLYFPNGFAYSLVYLNADEDIDQLRPQWVQLAPCADFDPRAEALLGIKYAFCRDVAGSPVSLPGWTRLGSEDGQSLFRRRNYDGGIRLYRHWVLTIEQTPRAARAAVLDAASHGVALIQGEVSESNVTLPSRKGPLTDRIELVVDRPGHMVLRTASGRGGILVIPDNYDPGWVALVNDKPVPVLKAFHAYLGVQVGPGSSQVQLDFLDRYFWTGLVISVVTACGLIVYAGCATLWESGTRISVGAR